MMNRLFVAVKLPDEIIDRLIIFRDEIYGSSKKARWEPKVKLHITLKFLGDVNSAKIPTIIDTLEHVISKYSNINLSATGFGLFRKKGIPSILWAGFEKNIFLEQLASQVDKELNILGFEKEKRAFKAHITLLRIKGSEDLNRLSEFPDYVIEDLNFKAEKITLFKSELLKTGSVYKEIKSFEIK